MSRQAKQRCASCSPPSTRRCHRTASTTSRRTHLWCTNQRARSPSFICRAIVSLVSGAVARTQVSRARAAARRRGDSSGRPAAFCVGASDCKACARLARGRGDMPRAANRRAHALLIGRSTRPRRAHGRSAAVSHSRRRARARVAGFVASRFVAARCCAARPVFVVAGLFRGQRRQSTEAEALDWSQRRRPVTHQPRCARAPLRFGAGYQHLVHAQYRACDTRAEGAPRASRQPGRTTATGRGRVAGLRLPRAPPAALVGGGAATTVATASFAAPSPSKPRAGGWPTRTRAAESTREVQH